MAQRTLSTLPSFPNTIKQENDRSWKAMNKKRQHAWKNTIVNVSPALYTSINADSRIR